MKITHRVTEDQSGYSAEKLLRKKLGFSQTMIRRLKRCSGVCLNGRPVYLKQRLKEGDILSIDIQLTPNTGIEPQPIPMDIIYEDRHLLVVNKPPHMLVHPLKHEPYNTLANAVLHHYRKNNIEGTFHPVSRLDRNTSGLVVIAKHPYAGFRLSQQLHSIDFQREYLAVVHGMLKQLQAVIALPIARCRDSKIKHTVDCGGRKAVTRYQVEKYCGNNTVVKLQLETGRTHQIRVHMSHIGHPLLGDSLYGGLNEGINRQALHCYRVSLTHPVTGALLSLQSPLPRDIQNLLNY
ncbi:23S rRNA pseudouridine1911/1915/1917 synthase [Desulfohalotomaculum tongense]|uniref:RluA family pseudouridine synthase n=1 Tax=Desulforadius tongensis TaxID=1216062 RepID=UPI001958F444|nr:RluA family pseudouridine synthase [Desulforadius tongensis]MBM7855656.1 23S rRNA pseudouridine1911/1915/1917 synthase [Desulforadius tongensis]